MLCVALLPIRWKTDEDANLLDRVFIWSVCAGPKQKKKVYTFESFGNPERSMSQNPNLENVEVHEVE